MTQNLTNKAIGIPCKSKPAQVIIGSISGIIGGMFAMLGPPIVLYCISTLENKCEYVTTLQAFSVTLNIFYTLFRTKASFYSNDIGVWWAIWVPVALNSSATAR